MAITVEIIPLYMEGVGSSLQNNQTTHWRTSIRHIDMGRIVGQMYDFHDSLSNIKRFLPEIDKEDTEYTVTIMLHDDSKISLITEEDWALAILTYQ